MSKFIQQSVLAAQPLFNDDPCKYPEHLEKTTERFLPSTASDEHKIKAALALLDPTLASVVRAALVTEADAREEETEEGQETLTITYDQFKNIAVSAIVRDRRRCLRRHEPPGIHGPRQRQRRRVPAEVHARVRPFHRT